MHTPGPWSTPVPIITDAGLPYSPIFATTLIAKVYSTAFGDHEQSVANARLMAAAPELLEALKAVVAISDRKHDAWDAAKAAIAKAQGN